MKNTILILISLLFLTGCMEEKEVTSLQDRGGIKYEINQEEPFTGKYVKYYDNGQKEFEEHYKDGKKDGLDTLWYENGQKGGEEHYKKGKREGSWTVWDKNGQKRLEWNFKDGKKDGLLTLWDKEGTVIRTETYKNGERVK